MGDETSLGDETSHQPSLGATLGLADLFGRSVLPARDSPPPPRHAYLSCAFDATCVGLVVERGSGRVAKYILWLGETARAPFKPRLQLYDVDADPYEEHDVSALAPEAARAEAVSFMRAWLRAVQQLHRSHDRSPQPHLPPP
jgi:hypothetical protein